MTFWYRYDIIQLEGGVQVYLGRYLIKKTTKKGVWLADRVTDRDRFVLRDGRKRFACPTIEEAKESFIRRKEKQIRINKETIKRAEMAIRAINEEKAEMFLDCYELENTNV